MVTVQSFNGHSAPWQGCLWCAHTGEGEIGGGSSGSPKWVRIFRIGPEGGTRRRFTLQSHSARQSVEKLDHEKARQEPRALVDRQSDLIRKPRQLLQLLFR